MAKRTVAKQGNPKCTEGELNAALAYFSLGTDTIRRVKRVLVLGETRSWVAQTEGVSYAAITKACDKLMDKIREKRRNEQAPMSDFMIPSEWETVTFAAPKEFIADMQRRLDQLIMERSAEARKRDPV